MENFLPEPPKPKYCKDCVHVYIKSIRNMKADEAVCLLPEQFTGLPRRTCCVEERANDKPGTCGTNGTFFKKR